MNRTTWTRRGLALVVAALMILSLLPAPAAQAITGDHLIVERYQPAGYENLSTVNSTSSTLEASSHGTFFKLNEAQTAPLYDWQLEWLCDDDLDAGWSTAFDEGITDPETPAWATVDLGKTAQLRRIVLFPVREEEYAANFPRALEIRLSDDNISWETAYTNGQVSASADEPLVVDLTELPTARYVQVYVTRRTDTPMTSEYGETLPVQIGEMAIFGSETIMTIDDFDSYMPTGCIALSQGKTVEISSGSDGSNLTDVDLATTWAPDDTDAAPYACIDLEAPYALRRVVLFPIMIPMARISPPAIRWRLGGHGELDNAPRGFRHSHAGKAGGYELEQPLVGRYVRISAADGEPLKLAEFAVFGESRKPISSWIAPRQTGAGRYRPAQGHPGQR
ncbi:MAG: discoidin domain-containing protein [Bianqueaceae bacterium]